MEAELRDRLEGAVLAAMDESAVTEMVWGVDDCALWCANILRKVLGYDPAAAYRGRYGSRREAIMLLGAGGIECALRETAEFAGWREIMPGMAKAGDVGLAWTIIRGAPTARVISASAPRANEAAPIRTLATVICRAPGWFVGRNEKGWTALRDSEVARAWSVI